MHANLARQAHDAKAGHHIKITVVDAAVVHAPAAGLCETARILRNRGSYYANGHGLAVEQAVDKVVDVRAEGRARRTQRFVEDVRVKRRG